MNQMYIDVPFSGYGGINLFCWGVLACIRFTKQIVEGGKPHFEVHQCTSSTSGIEISCSLAFLMNQMYIDVLLVVYGVIFAMVVLAGWLMYFSTGIDLHRSTFGSSGERFTVGSGRFVAYSREVGMKRKPFEAAKGPELEENIQALRRMRLILLLLILGVGSLCLYCGLFIGWKIYGGG
jgi:hypothetical protein